MAQVFPLRDRSRMSARHLSALRKPGAPRKHTQGRNCPYEGLKWNAQSHGVRVPGRLQISEFVIVRERGEQVLGEVYLRYLNV